MDSFSDFGDCEVVVGLGYFMTVSTLVIFGWYVLLSGSLSGKGHDEVKQEGFVSDPEGSLRTYPLSWFWGRSSHPNRCCLIFCCNYILVLFSLLPKGRCFCLSMTCFWVVVTWPDGAEHSLWQVSSNCLCILVHLPSVPSLHLTSKWVRAMLLPTLEYTALY